MNRLRNRLIAIFLAATLVPLGVTLWVAHSILERSLRYSTTVELDQLSKSLESTARQYYQRERESLSTEVAAGRAAGERFPAGEIRLWPEEMQEFWESGEKNRFLLGGSQGDRLYYLVRRQAGVDRYVRELGGVRMEAIRQQYARARKVVEEAQSKDLRRGLRTTLLVLAVVPWVAALAIVVFSAHRITAVATAAYNRMAGELQQSRERLLFLARLESWQALARKAAHEIKNSLTPIRLTMEELASRHSRTPEGNSFERQAAQIVVEEVNSLERRVRAFSEFAAEPPLRLKTLEANALLGERVAFLKAAHPEVRYQMRLSERAGWVIGDEDLLKAVLTNLLENAAEAAGPRGEVLAVTSREGGSLAIEVHDSGPGLSEGAKETLFEPAISFKQGGMGLGLSIARKSAVLCGGDIVLVKGELGGAGFRVVLAACPQNAS